MPSSKITCINRKHPLAGPSDGPTVRPVGSFRNLQRRPRRSPVRADVDISSDTDLWPIEQFSLIVIVAWAKMTGLATDDWRRVVSLQSRSTRGNYGGRDDRFMHFTVCLDIKKKGERFKYKGAVVEIDEEQFAINFINLPF